MLPQLAEFFSQPLLMEPSYASTIAQLSSAPNASTKAIINDVKAAATSQAAGAASSGIKVTAVVPVQGILDAKDSWVIQYLGGTSMESLSAAIELLMNEPRVSGIILDFNTPGGSAAGIKEVADRISQARNEKPIIGVVRYQMASGGYYLGAATSRIIAEPSSFTGSVGVYHEHYDESGMLEKMGVRHTIIRVPEYKAEGHPAEPLTDAAKSHLTKRVNDIYGAFTSDVGSYRGIGQQAVKDRYGKGRVLSARDALSAGMVDRIDTFANVVNQMKPGAMAKGIRPA